jgi:hypothetical protein
MTTRTSTSPLTPAQRGAIHAAFTRAGVTTRADRLATLSRLTCRDITTSNDLTTAEASMTLDYLRDSALDAAWINGDAPLQLPAFDRNTQVRERPHHADTCPHMCPVCDGIIAAQDHT